MTDLMAATAEFTILAFAGLLIAAAASDWRSLTIPNRYSLAIVALFPSYMLVTGNADWAMHLALGSGAFALGFLRSEEHTSELQSLMRISYAVFCLNKKQHKTNLFPRLQMTSQQHEDDYTSHLLDDVSI